MDQNGAQHQDSIWAEENTAKYLSLRVKTFYNPDYFERIVLPLLDLPPDGRVLDVGCGNGGLSFRLSGLRQDLQIMAIDPEAGALKSARISAADKGWGNLSFSQGDGHKLSYKNCSFNAVVCQTVLTHVSDAGTMVKEMARVLKPGGVFLAAEYTDPGVATFYSSVDDDKRDEAWMQKFFRISRLYIQGKRILGRGDDLLGERIPLLAESAGLDVFDVRLNDRVLHVFPPYRHQKQKDYLELLMAYFEPDSDEKREARFIETIKAAGGSVEDAQWLYASEDEAAVRKAIEERNLSRVSMYMLYLTFARKPSK